MHHLHNPVSVAGLIALAVAAFFIASQVFWLWKIRGWKQKIFKRGGVRAALDAVGAVVYAGLMYYGFWGAHRAPSPVSLTASAALLQAPFDWWVFGSVLGFFLYLLVRLLVWLLIRSGGLTVAAGVALSAGRRVRAAGRRLSTDQAPALKEPPAREEIEARSVALKNPGRRQFFRQASTAIGAIPFAAGAYGVLYGRLNLKVTNPRIALARLPRAFDGFRILQLSDLHIGPFMTARQIRKVADISNGLKPDLITLTGDFVTWDARTQYAVVDALSGLKAPYGVWGCLGNHEIWTHTEDSITALFGECGFRILRQQSALVFECQDFINLIGVDYQSRRSFDRRRAGFVREYLEGVDRLMIPGTANILFSHNPNTFDRAAELGIDLSLAGHTHGGQVSLEFLHANISPSRLITPYVQGWFRRGRGQLYVNRGIGTIGMPIRIGAPPEITVYHLVRALLAHSA